MRDCINVLHRLLSLLVLSCVLLIDAPADGAEPKALILLSNDDGPEAPGLEALYEAFVSIAEVAVVAPAAEQSGVSHGLTYKEAIMVERLKRPDGGAWYAVQARPATCVRLALTSLLERQPDLVIAGINRGENLGLQTWFSGTVAAAREAALWGTPAIAVSMGGHEITDYRAAAGYLRTLVERLRERRVLRPGLLLNVNIPRGAAGGIKGVKVSRLSRLLAQERYERRISPSGQLYFWNVWKPPADDEEGTDLHAYARGYLTITPLVLDQTHPGLLAELTDSLTTR